MRLLDRHAVLMGKDVNKWSLFNPEAKHIRHDTVFPEECKRVYEMGTLLAGK